MPARTPFNVYLPSCDVLAAALVPSANTRASLSGALLPCAVTRPVTVPCAHTAVPTRHIAPAMSTGKSDRENRASLILYSSLCECVSAKCCVGIEVGAEGVAFGECRCCPLA